MRSPASTDSPQSSDQAELQIAATRAEVQGDPLSTRMPSPEEQARIAAITVEQVAKPVMAFPNIPGYEILSELGRGGMGVVYKAKQIGLNRLVAIKMILTKAHAGAELLTRFKAEAESVARLQHPNIVQIYEIGEHDGLPFFSMEYVEGGSLAHKLKGEPQQPRDAAQLVQTLALAMHAAHQKQIVHRDLKPLNVLLTPRSPRTPRLENQTAEYADNTEEKLTLSDHVPKVTDFGLAKQLDADAGQTHTGAVFGTPSYMAPEQAEGRIRDIGPHSDVYALGAILYELLTGRPPFRAATPLDTVLQVIHDDPVPPRQLQSKTPRDLETICLKCLHKDAGKRYGSARDLADDLGNFLGGKPVAARAVGRWERGWRWCRRNPTTAILSGNVAAALVIGTIVSTSLAYWALGERHRADTESVTAKTNEATAKANEEEAKQNAAQTRRVLSDFSVANGFRALADGRALTARLWFAEPFLRDSDNAAAIDVARQRLMLYQRYARPAVMLDVFWHQGGVFHVEFSPDGGRVVGATLDWALVWDAATGEPVSPLLQHPAYVRLAAFSADGRRVVTASLDKTVRVWVATTGEPVCRPLQHQHDVWLAALSRDGRHVGTTSSDKTARVWDAATGRLVCSLLHQGDVWHLAFSPDGRRVVTASRDGSARVWDAATGQPVCPPLQHQSDVERAAFSADGRRVVTASSDKTARVWDAATGQPVCPPLQHQGSVRHAAFSPDGRRIVTASSDKTARVWDAATGQAACAPLQHQDDVWDAGFSPDGRRVVTASFDKTARVWDAATGQPVTPPLQHESRVHRAAFASDGRRVITASGETNVCSQARVWDCLTRQPVNPALQHTGSVEDVTFSADCRRVVTASLDNTARVWDSRTGQPVGPPLKHRGEVHRAAFSPDGRRVVTASGYNRQRSEARVWDAATGEPVSPPLQHEDSVRHAAFSPNGRWIVTASYDTTARVWDAATGQPVTPPLQHEDSVRHAAFSPDGRWVVTASDDTTARIWDAATGQPVTPPLKHLRSVAHAVFSPDGRRVVTASLDSRVWDAATGQPLTPPLQDKTFVNHAAFSPDGRRVVTASSDKTARVWDAATGQAIIPPLQHQQSVYYAEFSRDGRLVVTASHDNTARVWDAVTGQPVSPPLQHEGWVWHAAFSPDGQRVATASGDNTARLWDITSDDRPLEDRLAVVRLLAAHEIDATGGLQPIPAERLKEMCQTLRAKYPQDFTVTPAQARAWREEQIGQCLREGNLDAAQFHTNWLIAEMVLNAGKN